MAETVDDQEPTVAFMPPLQGSEGEVQKVEQETPLPVESTLPPAESAQAVETPVAEAAQEATPDIIQILAAFEGVKTGLMALQQGFDSKIKYDATKERVIDALHQELQTYRDGLHFKILQPIFMDLIAMHDDLGSLVRHNEGREGAAPETIRNLASFQETIESILERYGVRPFIEEGETFTPQRQRVARTVNTANPGQERFISERVRKGFEYAGKVLRPELVTIFKYVPTETVESSKKQEGG